MFLLVNRALIGIVEKPREKPATNGLRSKQTISTTPPEGSKVKRKQQKRQSEGDKTDEWLCCNCNNVANIDVIGACDGNTISVLN